MFNATGFKLEVSILLNGEDKAAVQGFIKSAISVRHQLETRFTVDYQSNRSDFTQAAKGSLKQLQKFMQSNPMLSVSERQALNKTIQTLQRQLRDNASRFTKGKFKPLNAAELDQLVQLHYHFSLSFPHLDNSFKRDSLLHRIGSQYLGRSLPHDISKTLSLYKIDTDSILESIHLANK